MHVARVEDPAAVGMRAVLHGFAHELEAEPSPAVPFEHVDVGEIDEPGRVAVDDACEADLLVAAVETQDTGACADQLVLTLARAALGPVRLAAEVRVDGCW